MAKKKEEVKTEEIKVLPAPVYGRDENELLIGVDYIKNERGAIDWRAMVDREFIVLNKQKKDEMEEEYDKTIEDIQKIFDADESEIEDKYKLILLGGTKELARLRGYTSVTYPYTVAGPEFVSTRCRIEWVPNYETGMVASTFEDGADAHFNNTFSWYGHYLTTAASNRAFVRAVRNFLGVNLVGVDEVGPSKDGKSPHDEEATTSSSTISRLSSKKGDAVRVAAEAVGVTFEDLKAKCISQGMKGVEDWSEFSDISGNNALIILNALEKKKSEAK